MRKTGEHCYEISRSDYMIDYPSFIQEIYANTAQNRNWVLNIPLKVFNDFMIRIAKRATELDDPQLNIIMLKMKMYEVPHNEIIKRIAEQEKRINKKEVKK